MEDGPPFFIPAFTAAPTAFNALFSTFSFMRCHLLAVSCSRQEYHFRIPPPTHVVLFPLSSSAIGQNAFLTHCHVPLFPVTVPSGRTANHSEHQSFPWPLLPLCKGSAPPCFLRAGSTSCLYTPHFIHPPSFFQSLWQKLKFSGKN